VAIVRRPRARWRIDNGAHGSVDQRIEKMVCAKWKASGCYLVAIWASTNGWQITIGNIYVISDVMARPKRFELLTPRFVVWCLPKNRLHTPR
jgi:hypothetical protein